MMASPSYCTLDRVKWLIGLPSSYVDQDEEITSLIESVSVSFDTFLGQSFSATPRHESHAGGVVQIVLNYIPSPGVDMTVKENGVAVEPSGYSVSGSIVTRVIPASPKFAVWEVGNCFFQYTSGYADPPADIAKAAAEESARGFRQANTGNGSDNRLGVTSSTPETGGSSSFTADEWSPATQQILANYNRRFI